MSRQHSSAQRSLTLTEELEKLEQSITLTLQEIDHNFSRAHRIVTSSILPTVEQYAEQSREVWEGSKFWKRFFESSANVSLSGYEDQPQSESGQNTTLTEDDSTAEAQNTTEEGSASYSTPSSEHLHLLPREDEEEDPDLSSLSLSPSHSTPRPSTYNKNKKKLNDNGNAADDITSSSIDELSLSREDEKGTAAPSSTSASQPDDAQPTTPKRRPPAADLSTVTPGGPHAAFPPPSHLKPSTVQKADNPVLHRVLDKTYRIQATPLGKGYSAHDTTTPKRGGGYAFDDDNDGSPLSSPELEAPKLHSELFSPAVIKRNAGRTPRLNKPRSPPKPGSSVLTPAKHKAQQQTQKHGGSGWDSDDDFGDEDDDATGSTAMFGRSPPKTIGFHVPQSKLLKTPAKDASKQIVSDLLHTAGGASDFTEDDINSPSVVRRSENIEDDQPF